MDQSFFLRAKRLLDQPRRHPVDHAALLAVVTARQQATPTAAQAGSCRANARPEAFGNALVSLLLAEPGWEQVTRTQCGCFNRAVARRRVNTP